jgi:adenylyl cyclase-associated protein
MKTHKNPALRGSSVVKVGDVKSSATTAPKYGGAAAAKKPPKLELQNKKWVVEYQENQRALEISDTNPKQSVYVFRCTGCTLVVKGKCNSIILDNCKKFALVFDDVIAACEIINSQRVQVQVNGKCPTVSIDKTDGCQVFLSKDSMACEIVTAKSSEMNICIPKDDGDISEHAVPEQFKSSWNGKRLVTTATDINA